MKDKKAILFNGTPKEIGPHFEDLKKRYDSVEEAVEDLGEEGEGCDCDCHSKTGQGWVHCDKCKEEGE